MHNTLLFQFNTLKHNAAINRKTIFSRCLQPIKRYYVWPHKKHWSDKKIGISVAIKPSNKPRHIISPVLAANKTTKFLKLFHLILSDSLLPEGCTNLFILQLKRALNIILQNNNTISHLIRYIFPETSFVSGRIHSKHFSPSLSVSQTEVWFGTEVRKRRREKDYL